MSIEALTVAQRTLQHRLQDIPDATSPHLRMGFSLLSRLSEERLKLVVEYVASNFAKRTRYDPEKAAEISGIDRNVVGDLLSAVALTVGAVFDIDVTSVDFFALAPNGLIEESSRPTIEKVLERAIAQRAQLKEDYDKSRIANAVLPSFRSSEHAIDVRLKFNDKFEIVDKVPIAVFHIETDTADDVWFQLSSADLMEFFESVQKAKLRMEAIQNKSL